MVREIIKELCGFYNKTVVFDTEFGKITKNTRDFKLEEDVIGENRYITIARIEEFEDHITVVDLKIRTVNNKKFLEMNPR
jgi:hypothetical protein